MHHAFLYISLPSLHDYDMEIPILTVCGGRELKATTFFSFSGLSYSHLEFNSRKNCQHNQPLYNEALGITNDFLYPTNRKISGKQPRLNETSL